MTKETTMSGWEGMIRHAEQLIAQAFSVPVIDMPLLIPSPLPPSAAPLHWEARRLDRGEGETS